MSLFEHNSFRVPKTVAEIMIRQKLQDHRDLSVPEIDFDTMSKPPQDAEPPQFRRPAKTNTLRGSDPCCHNP
jgi:hypothetical protein